MSEEEPPPSQEANLLGQGTRTRVTQFRPKAELATQMAVPGLWGRGPSGAELCSANPSKCLGGGTHSVIH